MSSLASSSELVEELKKLSQLHFAPGFKKASVYIHELYKLLHRLPPKYRRDIIRSLLLFGKWEARLPIVAGYRIEAEELASQIRKILNQIPQKYRPYFQDIYNKLAIAESEIAHNPKEAVEKLKNILTQLKQEIEEKIKKEYVEKYKQEIEELEEKEQQYEQELKKFKPIRVRHVKTYYVTVTVENQDIEKKLKKLKQLINKYSDWSGSPPWCVEDVLAPLRELGIEYHWSGFFHGLGDLGYHVTITIPGFGTFRTVITGYTWADARSNLASWLYDILQKWLHHLEKNVKTTKKVKKEEVYYTTEMPQDYYTIKKRYEEVKKELEELKKKYKGTNYEDIIKEIERYWDRLYHAIIRSAWRYVRPIIKRLELVWNVL
ncbi:MAG: hypothetical protein GXO26_01750 [Crenarchaeota archaeon]|nr:hypothetical protein [Thermoproteota archaeon]